MKIETTGGLMGGQSGHGPKLSPYFREKSQQAFLVKYIYKTKK